jgi:predicted NBD/HSP70 family sugar kinase
LAVDIGATKFAACIVTGACDVLQRREMPRIQELFPGSEINMVGVDHLAKAIKLLHAQLQRDASLIGAAMVAGLE